MPITTDTIHHIRLTVTEAPRHIVEFRDPDNIALELDAPKRTPIRHRQ